MAVLSHTRTADEEFLGSPILNIPDIAKSEDIMLDIPPSSAEAIILKFVAVLLIPIYHTNDSDLAGITLRIWKPWSTRS